MSETQAKLTVGVELTPELLDLVERAEAIHEDLRRALTMLACDVVRDALRADGAASEDVLRRVAVSACRAAVAGVGAAVFNPGSGQASDAV